MSLRILPKQYHIDFTLPRKKPLGNIKIDRSNVYGKNVFAAWNFATQTGWLEDIAKGSVAERVGSSVVLQPSDGNLNLFSDGNNGNDRLNLGSITASNPVSLTTQTTGDKYTIFSRVRIPSGTLSNSFPRIIDKSSGGNAANGWMLNFGVSSGAIEFWLAGSMKLQSPTVARDTWLNIAVVVDGTGTNDSVIYVNELTPDLGTATVGNTTTTNAAISNWNHSTDRQWDGEISYIHMHYGAYSEGQVKRYWKSPNQIFEPQDPVRYFTSDAVGGLTLTPTGIPSSEVFGSAIIILDDSFISPSSIASLEAFGGVTIITGGVTLSPTAVPSQEALGNPELIYPQIVVVSGIGSEEVFGIATIQDGVEVIIPVGDRDTYQKIGRFLAGTGKFVSTQNNDIIVEWLKSEGIDAKQFNDLFFKYWTGQGFTGAYNDRWKQWKDS